MNFGQPVASHCVYKYVYVPHVKDYSTAYLYVHCERHGLKKFYDFFIHIRQHFSFSIFRRCDIMCCYFLYFWPHCFVSNMFFSHGSNTLLCTQIPVIFMGTCICYGTRIRRGQRSRTNSLYRKRTKQLRHYVVVFAGEESSEVRVPTG